MAGVISRRMPRATGARRTFLLGAGCQKGGTTWLYRYLKASPQFAAGYRKEYHVFDTRDVPAQDYMRNRILTWPRRRSPPPG